jgi:hypothetical protein
VAFVAFTVRVDELPAAIEAGAAEMLTVGKADVRLTFPPHPVNSRGSKMQGTSRIGIESRDLLTRASVMIISFLSR